MRPKRRSGELETIADIEQTEKLGVGQVDEFSPQLLMSFDACVQCGRCESVCPATASGMEFSPKDIVRGLFESLHRDVTYASQGTQAKPLLGSAVKKETPWMCTTCGACITACPLFIDPVDSIVDMRRYVTMTTGDVPGSVGEALTQMERRGNPWGLPKENRAPWAAELGVRVLKPGEKVDMLLFVGCAAAYDSRSQAAARDFASLLQKAGVDFAILGTAEGCCGETARRLGHEYLFQTMAQENLATLSGVSFNRIVTMCAHCYNTLRNEYPKFGGEFQIVHHTQLLAELVAQGRLKWSGEGNGKVHVLHDSCYLARYNDIVAEPRTVLDRLPGMKRREMPRREMNTFCCGGGGGQMWMETDPNTRINQRRLDEAVAAGADVLVAACPYCLIMFDDAIRSKGISDKVAVKEIAEVVAAHTA
jgi:Fe-S oxidoreductase